jgi:hypothetical protein
VRGELTFQALVAFQRNRRRADLASIALQQRSSPRFSLSVRSRRVCAFEWPRQGGLNLTHEFDLRLEALAPTHRGRLGMLTPPSSVSLPSSPSFGRAMERLSLMPTCRALLEIDASDRPSRRLIASSGTLRLAQDASCLHSFSVQRI